MNSCDVSVILVNYNGKKYIDTLFESLINLDHDNISFEVVFVDNNSSDGSVEYLQEKYVSRLDVNIVQTGENKGFAGGNNAGVRAARGKYIVLLNNDTAVDKDWLTEMYNFITSREDCIMVNSKLLFFYDFVKLTCETADKVKIKRNIEINGQGYKIDNKYCKNALCYEDEVVLFGHSEINIPLIAGEGDYVIKAECIEAAKNSSIAICGQKTEISEDNVIMQLSKEAVEKGKYSLIQNAGSGVNENYDGYDIGFCEPDGEKFNAPYEINNGCGAAIMMKKEDFESVGGFDESFFMYYEDTDLSYRIKKNGGKIMYCPTAVVRHIHTGSSTEWSPFFTYHVYRNKLLFIKKNISTAKYIKYFVKQLLVAYREKDSNKRKATMDSLRMIRKKM